MKTNFNFKALLLTVFLVAGFTINSQAQLKVGYMNPQKVLNALPAVEQVQKEIDKIITERDTELSKDAANVQKQFAEYQQKQATLSEERRAQEEERLTQLNTELENKRNAFQQEILQKRAQLLQPIYADINTAMEEVAKEMGIDMVLNQQTNTGDVIIFYAAENQLDISNEVINKVLEKS